MVVEKMVDIIVRALLLGSVMFPFTASLPMRPYRRTELYHGQLVVKCELTEEFVEGLNSLMGQESVDIWGMDKDNNLQIRLGSQFWAELQDTTPECTVVIANLEDYMAQAEIETAILESSDEISSKECFTKYHRYEDIVDWYKDLQNNYSSIVRFVNSIGESSEGRAIPAVHIKGPETSPSGSVYFQCLIHAREWISGSVCMYISKHLCTKYEEKDEQVTRLLNELEFIIVPIVNPDGYEYTWTDDRMWRKNRANTSTPGCRGVDLNRNFNDHWNEGGSSDDPCSDIYCGTEPASEPETQAIQNYFKNQRKIIASIDWHSFSQLILRPFGWTNHSIPDEEQIQSISERMSARIKTVNGKVYTPQKIWDLYTATGGASDWFYGEDATKSNDGVRAAGLTIELRDRGIAGFLLPPQEIIPTVEEVTPAFLLFVEEMLKNPIISSASTTNSID